MRKKALIFTVIFGIIFLAVLLVSASIYKSAMAQKEEGHEAAAAEAKKKPISPMLIKSKHLSEKKNIML